MVAELAGMNPTGEATGGFSLTWFLVWCSRPRSHTPKHLAAHKMSVRHVRCSLHGTGQLFASYVDKPQGKCYPVDCSTS